MADNLSISVTADTSSLQAQLAIARAEVAAYAAEVRKAASAVVGGDSSQLANLEQFAGSLAGARSQVSALTTELKDHHKTVEEHASVLGRLKEAGSEAASGLKEVGSSLLALGGLSGGVGAIAGFFAVEGIIEFIKGTAEAAEKTENMSAALGIAPRKLALLGAEFKLVGGDIETAMRALTTLETKLEEAVSNPSSNAREALLKLHISVQDMRDGLTDLPGMLAKIGEGFRAMPEGADRTQVLVDIFSRKGFQAVVPLLRKPAEELKAEVQEALGGKLPTDEGIHKLAEYEEKLNTLGLAFGGLKKAIVSAFIEPLTEATATTTNWVKDTRKAVDDVKGLLGTASTVGGAGVGAIIGGTFLGPIGALAGAAIGATAGLDGLASAAKTAAGQVSQIGAGWSWFAQKWDDLQETLGHGRPSGTFSASSGASAKLPPKEDADEGLAFGSRFNPTEAERAFLEKAKQHESSGDYFLLHGPAHHRISDTKTFPAWEGFKGPGGISHAAGAYGFEPGTYAEMAAKTGLSDFSARSQDINALELLRERGKTPWPWAGKGGEGGETATAGGGVVKPAEEQKEMDRQIKQLEDWSKVEAAGYEAGIQAAKYNSQETIRLAQQKTEMLQRTAVQEQAIRDSFAAKARDRGNVELADKYATGGGSLQEKELKAQKELISLQQRADEETANSAIKASESDRRISDQKTQTQLQEVEKQRELGNITAAEAAAREEEIVNNHLAAVEKIFAAELAAAGKITKLQDEVANHQKEAEAKATEDIKRIRDKAQQEEEARAHAIDKQIASEFASSAVGLAWGKQTPLQALGGFEQKIETKTLEFAGAKLLDATGVGKIFEKLGDQVTKFFGGTVESAAANAPVVAAITGAGPIATATAMAPVMEAQTGQIVAAIVGGASTGAGGSIIGGAVSGGLGLAAKGFAGGPAVAATVSSGTSVLDDLIPALLAIPFLEGGGVIPSAADGMVNDGRGGRLSVLHPQEMVLPANISLGLQSMIRTGGWSIPGAPSPFSLSPNFAGSAAGAAAGGMPVTINLSAIDSRSGAQFLMDHSRSIAKAIAAEQRNFNGRVL